MSPKTATLSPKTATLSPKPATIRQHCCQKHNVVGFGDIVDGFGDNVAVLATLSLVWTGLKLTTLVTVAVQSRV